MTSLAGTRHRLGPPVLMAGGLAVVGIAGYGFVALAGHTLSTRDASSVSALYLLINLIGPGAFAALEQETSRSVSARLAVGGRVGPVGRHAAVVGGGLLVVLMVVLAGLAPVLVPSALGANWGLFGALVLGTVSAGLVYLVRGLLGGTRRFNGYAATLAGEGVARFVPCVLVAVSGAPNATVYALIFACGSVFGALAGTPWLRRPAIPGEPVDVEPGGTEVAGMARRLALLVGSTALAQLVANLAPIVVAGRLGTNTALAAAFTSAFVLVRLPLTAFAPVQAMLLPTLTAAATRGDLVVLRGKLRVIVWLSVAVGLAGVLVSGAVGPWAVRVLFGAHTRLAWPVLGALAAGTLLLMVAQVLQPGLVALGQHRLVTGSWLLGSVVLAGLLFLPGDPLRAAVFAQLAGSALVVAGMAVTLRRFTHR
ncbi:MAG TPA: hypothetical protein VH352_06475 [Pseudonocardiaceae bacterium]|nr:hypothetical protein [Pseudonocardiaceae bacterium]